MKFTDKYTTQELIQADAKGIEAKKVVISTDTYAKCEMFQNIIDKLEHLRLTSAGAYK